MRVTELKERDPKRFEKEYYKWIEHAVDYDWWENSQEDFKADCDKLGVQVDRIQFSGFYSQGDGATFNGRVYVYEWMENQGHHLMYPAAYLACKDDGSYVDLEATRSLNMRASLNGPTQLCPVPSGIFAGLDQETWEALVNEQMVSLQVEDEILSFCKGLADKLYEILRDEYDYLTSEEMFIDDCDINEVTFEENEDAVYI